MPLVGAKPAIDSQHYSLSLSFSIYIYIIYSSDPLQTGQTHDNRMLDQLQRASEQLLVCKSTRLMIINSNHSLASLVVVVVVDRVRWP